MARTRFVLPLHSPVDYEVGDTIAYDVHGQRRVAVVTDRDEDIKNGMPGFDAEIIQREADGAETRVPVWGYDCDIIRVVERAKR